MKTLILALSLLAGPALAATGPFVSLGNTDFVVLLGFLVFVGILLYARVPARIAGLLDARANQIRADLDEARQLRDEAKALVASYERRQTEVQEQSRRIVDAARAEAEAAALQAREDLRTGIARRLAAAKDQIASAETAAVRAVREQAVSVAVAAASDILTRQMSAERTAASIDAAIAQVGARLN